jgi:diguanylate cyclase (GGDEF)-like protein/PAS domain S-box-containing protein
VTEASGPGAADVTTVACLASEVVDIYDAAAATEPTARQLLRLSQICEDLYAAKPCQATYDAILSLAAQLGDGLEHDAARFSPGVGERLGQCTSQVRLSLTKALLDVRNNAYYELRKAIRDEYQITLDLLADHNQDPRLLAWLANTEARRGVLALWRDQESGRAKAKGCENAAEEPELDMVATFDASGQDLVLGSGTMVVGSFPPDELFGSDSVRLVCVFPVKSPGTDWGFLAIAEPPGSRLDQEAYFMWSALFSEALDHRALLASLNQRSEDLARSYRREREMAQAVRESEERYALAAQAANDGLWDWDVAKGTMYFSSRWKEMFGFDEGFISASPDEWLGRVHPEDRSGLLNALAGLKCGERGSVLNEHRVRARDGAYLWVLCRGLAVPGLGAPATRVVGSLTDITERRSLEERLRRQALYDSLTGLANRVLFLDRLSHAIATAKRQGGSSYTVLWLDLDNFKNLNDTLGHLYGDKLLVQVAERIRARVRETDTAARFGGDEFVLLLQDAGAEAVESVVRRLSQCLNEPYDLDGEAVVVTASIGVAMSTGDYERPEEILRDADIAMYRAKATGSGSCVMFDRSMPGSSGGSKGRRRSSRSARRAPAHAPFP